MQIASMSSKVTALMLMKKILVGNILWRWSETAAWDSSSVFEVMCMRNNDSLLIWWLRCSDNQEDGIFRELIIKAQGINYCQEMGISSVVHEDLGTARQQMNGLAEAAGKISQERKMMKIRGRCNYSSSPPARSLRAANSLLNLFRCSVNNWIVVVCFLMLMQHTVPSMGVTQKMRYSAGLGRGSFKISRLLG